MSEVTTQSNKPDVTSDTTSGMSVSSPVSVGPVKPTGHKTVEGSRPGDHRAPNYWRQHHGQPKESGWPAW